MSLVFLENTDFATCARARPYRFILKKNHRNIPSICNRSLVFIRVIPYRMQKVHGIAATSMGRMLSAHILFYRKSGIIFGPRSEALNEMLIIT